MPSYAETLPHVIDVLRPYAHGHDLHENTDLVAHLGIDSTQAMEIVLEAEERLDISIPLNVLASVRTVRDFTLQLQHLTSQV
jgi:acyl carrier protein